MILMVQVCAQSFLAQTCNPMSKVRVWLALENNFLAMNTCPMQDCQMQLRGFFLEFTGRATKCKDAKARAQHQRSKTAGPLQSQVTAKMLRQKEVCPWRESRKVGSCSTAVACRHLPLCSSPSMSVWSSLGKLLWRWLARLGLLHPCTSTLGAEGTEGNTSVTHISQCPHLPVLGLQVSLQILLACDSNPNPATAARLSRCLQMIIN